MLFRSDDVSIRDSAYVHVKTLSQLFTVLVLEGTDRRVGYFTFALNFYLGGLDTFGYHLTNILIHILNGWLIFWLIRKTLMLPRVRATAFAPGAEQAPEAEAVARRAWTIAFFSALIWLVHPVQIQAVTYIVQRLASLSVLLVLISLALYLSGRLRTDRSRYLFYGGSALAGLLGMGVKQTAAMFPFLIFLYELYFFHESPWRALKRRWAWAVLLAVLPVGILVAYMGPTFWEKLQAGYAGRDFTMGQRLLSGARVTFYYLSLIAWPLPSRLTVDYDFPVSSSLWQPPTTLPSVIAILALVGWALATASSRRLLSFSMLWFLGNLVPESTIMPLDLVFEHRLYLASLGPIAAATAFVVQALSARRTWLAALLLSLAAATLAVWTYQRNEVWTDPVRLWSDNLQKSPGKARVHGNLGKALLDAGRYQEAAAEFETVLTLNPAFLGAYNSLAVIYIDHLKQYDRATQYLRAALERNPNYPDAYLNLGVIALNERRLGDAIQALTKVLELDPQNLLGHYNLAACYVNLRDFPKPFEILDRGLAYWPASHRLYLLKGRAYLLTRNLPEARNALERAYILRPDDPEIRYYLAQVR